VPWTWKRRAKQKFIPLGREIKCCKGFAREATDMLKKIVVPVDGSENSLRALDFAVALGKKFNSHIIVFNVAIPYDYTKLPPKKAGKKGDVEDDGGCTQRHASGNCGEAFGSCTVCRPGISSTGRSRSGGQDFGSGSACERQMQ
jgi:hypothetical protein